MKKLWISLVFILAMGLAGQAQEDKAYRSAMTKMLEVSRSMDAMKRIAPQIITMLKQRASEQVPQQFWEDLEKEMISMYDRMIQAMIPVYQKYLTLEDIQGIIAFYETPVGKKLADSNTKIAVEIMPLAQQIGTETMQVLMEKMKEKGYIK